ncbi:MAG: heavy-metal-associated domain-containing protein [Comamonas sp.]
MIVFNVQDMTCGHCAGVISRALAQTDRAAQVQIDVPTRQIRIAPSADTDAEALADAIHEAGYTPVQVAELAAAPAPAGGCCCR